MTDSGVVFAISFGYMALLFAIAYIGDRRADMGRSMISNSYIYALSLAVYCTAWTFYGSVGRAVRSGPGFLPIYIGPTLVAALGWLILRKMIRISKIHRITSIADFIASRYGKSSVLGGAVAVIAVLGIIPYISLQLKAISTSFLMIRAYPEINMPEEFLHVPVLNDTSFYVALLLAVFAILFGTRHLEATERHEGLVLAIAFESLLKLISFLVAGAFVTYCIYDGFSDLTQRAVQTPELRKIIFMDTETLSFTDWFIYIFLSTAAVMFLPRQFQISVVENVNERHLNKAMWLFPLYLLAINIFVIPVAIGGLLHFPNGEVDADMFVLALPMAEHQLPLAMFAYLGGMSAATGMVIVETIALSTMLCNDLVMPVLLRLPFLNLSRLPNLSSLILIIRRGSIIIVLLLGYAYFRFIGEFYALVSIGLVSFAAVAQFAPAIIGGVFWKNGTKAGALSGLIAGFIIWIYTLFLPSLAQAGFLPERFITEGPFGIALLKPFQLFGLSDFDQITHAVFWSMLVNIGAYIGVSLFSRASALEHTQAALFVDVFRYSGETEDAFIWRGTASVPDLKSLLARFLGKSKTDEMLTRYAKKHEIDLEMDLTADTGIVSYAEKILASAIGSASARVMVASVVKEEPPDIEKILDILDETRQVIAYSRELEKVTLELKAANERLKELDLLKDEFISTVTHELRTPLTSISSLAQILHDNPGIDTERHNYFTEIIIEECNRLTRLIGQVLDFQKFESGAVQWALEPVDICGVIRDSIKSTDQLIRNKSITLETHIPDTAPVIDGARDRLIQVMVNLISNAVKFCPDKDGKITINLDIEPGFIVVKVMDNGIGFSERDKEAVFDKFKQVTACKGGRPQGAGLGLTISRRILELHGGAIKAESEPGKGSTFTFKLPISSRKHNSRPTS